MCKKIFLLSILLLSSMMMIFSCCEAEKEEPENKPAPASPQTPVIATESETLTYKINEQPRDLTIVATVTDGGVLSYQWYESDTADGEYTAIKNALEKDYLPNTSKVGTTYYKCTVTNTLNGKTASETSPVLTVIVNKNEVIPDEPQKPVIAAEAETLTYKLNKTADALAIVAVVADGGTLSYQWYKSDSLDGEYTVIADVLASNYTPDTSKLGTTYYKCTVTNTLNGKTASETSPVFTVEVVKDTDVVIPEISQIFSYKVGQTPDKLVVSAEATEKGEFSYKWYKATADKNEFVLIDNESNAEYTPDISKAGTTYYKCTVTNTLGEMIASADTPIFTVIVTEVGNAMPPTVKATASYVVQIKKDAILKVEATSGDEGKLSYQWSSSTDNTNFSDLPGKTGAALTVTPTEIGTVYYKCKVTNTVTIEEIEKTATSEVVITVEVETGNGNINIDFN